MKSEDSIFGAEPDRLRQLIRSGMDVDDADEQDSQAASGKFSKLMERPGSRIGCYKLLRVLGEGGMGVVYLAEQEQLIRRRVALKIIKPGMDSKRVLARFETERQALALLDHPNIAQVHDAGTSDSGRPYFVMEYVKGVPITEFCDRHALSIEERLRLFQQVCGALQHAHQKGIIHRDIKPSNIIVTNENDQVIPKIIDFGVAKAVTQPLTERTLITEDNQLLGTPEYMSPEQADMAGEDIDTRTDIYSLGVLLYVLLTGVLPFDSKELRESGIENVRKVIRETDPKTPSTRLTKLGQDAKKVAEKRRTEVAALAKCLHRELEWIPLKAMRKERNQRYRSASELADDIENYLNGAPLIAGPVTTIYRLKKFVRRHKALVTGIAAVMAVLVAGIIVSTFFAIGQARARAEAQAVINFLKEDVFGTMDDTGTQEVTAGYFLDTATPNLQSKFKDQPLIEASIRDTLGGIYRGLGEMEKAEQHLERALKLHQEHLGAEHPSTVKCMHRLAHIYGKQGRYGEAEAQYLKTLEIGRRVLGEDHGYTVITMNALAWLYYEQGSYDEAESLFEEALNTGKYIAASKDGLAYVYTRQKRYDEAEALFNEALEEKKHRLGEEHPWTLVVKHGLAVVYKEQARYEEAEPLLLEAANGRIEKLKLQHPKTQESIKALIELYEAWNKPEKAEHWRAKLSQAEAVE